MYNQNKGRERGPWPPRGFIISWFKGIRIISITKRRVACLLSMIGLRWPNSQWPTTLVACTPL